LTSDHNSIPLVKLVFLVALHFCSGL